MVHFFQGEAVRELHKHYHFVILNVSEESEPTVTTYGSNTPLCIYRFFAKLRTYLNVEITQGVSEANDRAK